MDLKDIVVSQVGSESPKLHTIQINDTLINTGIELQRLTMIGASIESVNSEYRQFNGDSLVLSRLISGKHPSDHAKLYPKLYTTIKKAIDSYTKNQVIVGNGIEIKNVVGDGIAYLIVYYLLVKHYRLSEEDFVNLNKFAIIAPAFKLFDDILNTRGIKISKSDLSAFEKHVLTYTDCKYKIGSKLLPLTRHQIENTSGINQTIWKTMYINQLVRNISLKQRQFLFAPTLGWGLVSCATKHIFTNDQIVSKVMFGENINYIRLSASKQLRLSSELIKGQIYDQELDDIKRLTFELKETTKDIDYALGDLGMVLFYPNLGKSLFYEMSAFIDETKSKQQIAKNALIAPMILNHNVFQQVVFQYLYANFLLTKLGVIHNDPHLNNILISENTKVSKKMEYFLSPGNNITIDGSPIQLTLIDFDKSILSHHHHNSFNDTVDKINEEVAVIFNEDFKKTIAEDYTQVFNCYAMYDVIKFSLIMKRILADIENNTNGLLHKNSLSAHSAFLDKLIKLSTSILGKIFDQTPKFPFTIAGTHSSMEWLIVSMFNSHVHIAKNKSSITKAVQIVDSYSSSQSDQPEFVSSRRKYADTLKYNFISQYVSSLK